MSNSRNFFLTWEEHLLSLDTGQPKAKILQITLFSFLLGIVSFILWGMAIREIIVVGNSGEALILPIVFIMLSAPIGLMAIFCGIAGLVLSIRNPQIYRGKIIAIISTILGIISFCSFFYIFSLTG